jgi:hypothetical protein
MRTIAVAALFLLSTVAYADTTLALGVNEIRARAFDGVEVVVKATVAPPSSNQCVGWRWGAEDECPKFAIVGLDVAIGGERIFIPRSAFADIGSPTRWLLKRKGNSLELSITGGDAATAFTSTWKFTKNHLKVRKTHGSEFRRDAWEEIRYSFPD